MADRASLDAQYQAIEARFANDEKNCHYHPLGAVFLVVPRVFEFWQGRRARLHDRFRYTLDKTPVGNYSAYSRNYGWYSSMLVFISISTQIAGPGF